MSEIRAAKQMCLGKETDDLSLALPVKTVKRREREGARHCLDLGAALRAEQLAIQHEVAHPVQVLLQRRVLAGLRCQSAILSSARVLPMTISFGLGGVEHERDDGQHRRNDRELK